MEASKKVSLIDRYVRSTIGAPILDACSMEKDALPVAYDLASVDYWVALPHTSLDSINLNNVGGSCSCSYNIKISDIHVKAFPEAELRDKSYFIGITRFDQNNGVLSGYNADFNPVDAAILGMSSPGSYYPGIDDPRYITDRLLLAESQNDVVTGEVDWTYDNVRREIKLIVPSMFGQITMWYGWGFVPEATTEYIPMNHLMVYAKMVALQFLSTIIAARSTIDFQGDYTLNMDAIQSRREELKEEVTVELSNLSMMPAAWG